MIYRRAKLVFPRSAFARLLISIVRRTPFCKNESESSPVRVNIPLPTPARFRRFPRRFSIQKPQARLVHGRRRRRISRGVNLRTSRDTNAECSITPTAILEKSNARFYESNPFVVRITRARFYWSPRTTLQTDYKR